MRIVTALLVALVATRAIAGELRGVVGIRPGAGESAGPLVDAVVAVEAPPSGTPPGTHAVMIQRDHAFHPAVLAIAAGTTVDFPNQDPVLHDVNSASPAQPFDLGLYDGRQVRSVRFDTPGVVRVRCNVHPRMAGIIVVHANAWVAVTDAQGHYAIADVPAGTHEVHVWRDGFVDRRVTVSVPERGVAPFDVQMERAKP